MPRCIRFYHHRSLRWRYLTGARMRTCPKNSRRLKCTWSEQMGSGGAYAACGFKYRIKYVLNLRNSAQKNERLLPQMRPRNGGGLKPTLWAHHHAAADSHMAHQAAQARRPPRATAVPAAKRCALPAPEPPPFSRSVLVLKKLGNELLPHLMETLSYLRARPPTPRACAHGPQPQSRRRAAGRGHELLRGEGGLRAAGVRDWLRLGANLLAGA